LTLFHSVMSHEKDETEEEISEKARINIEAINDSLDKVGTKKAKKLKVKKAKLDMIIKTADVLEPICLMLTTFKVLRNTIYLYRSILVPKPYYIYKS
jgi:hypothetical protein